MRNAILDLPDEVNLSAPKQSDLTAAENAPSSQGKTTS